MITKSKTRVGLMTIKALLKKYPQFRVLVVVPTETLQKQWLGHIDEWGFQFNVEVVIINTAVKHSWNCDFLIIDEAHRCGADEFSKIFRCVKYKLILGLTATIERLDGKHVLIEKYCPVVDNISTIECLVNGWISEYKEYQVLIEVDDIDRYKALIAIKAQRVLPYPVLPTIVPLPLRAIHFFTDSRCRSVLVMLFYCFIRSYV